MFALLLVLSGWSVKAQTGVVMKSSFETSNMKTGFQVLEGCCTYSLAQSFTQKRSGTSSMRVELRKSDPEAQYGNKRAELTHNNFSTESMINKNLRWWKWSNYLPKATFAQDPAEEVFAQWHDKHPDKSTSPPLAFEVKNGRYRIVIRHSTQNYLTSPNYVTQYFDLGPVLYDQWADWVVNYNPQYTSDGFVKIWLNGKQVLDYKGPCFYNGSWFPYFKIGIYKWLWMGSGSSSTTNLRVFYVDDVWIGDNTASQSTFVGTTAVAPANVAPTASAGTDLFITLPTSSVTLNGANSSDADGNIASYKWSQVSGPNTATFSNSSASQTTASGLVAGTYSFRLTVTDNAGATATDNITVTVASSTSTNVAPTANAGSNKTITLPTNSTGLTGSGTDSDGSIASYKWSQVSGPNSATFSSTTSASTTTSNMVAGTYSFRLTVTDNKGATASATVSVVVNPANKAPVASAGSNKTITLPTNSTTLSGSGTDSDGSIASYKWSQVSGPGTATFSSTTSASTTVSNLVAGTYSFRLTVTDNKGATGSATVSVVVNPAPVANVAPTANAGSNKTITLPTNSTTLSGSGTDSDGSIASYKWSQVSGPGTATFSSTTSASTTVSNLVAGTYSFRLTVTDNKGATGSATVSVVVNPAPVANVAPTANAGSNKTITLPTNSTTLSGSGTDSDGSIASYKWSQVSGPNTATFSSTTSASTTVSNLVAGTYSFRLTVTDNKGATGSATVSVVVNAATVTNQAPVARPGANQVIHLPATSATLNGSASSDPDGSISAYRWSQVSGPSTATFSSTTSASVTVSKLVAGSYSFRLTVTDNKGATGTATVSVIVNKPPVAGAGSKTITLPTNSVQLSSTSYDPDGSLSSYKWKQVSGPSTATFNNTTTSMPTVSGLVAGTYTLNIAVVDNRGAQANANVTITVNKATAVATKQAPIAKTVGKQTLAGTSVTLNGEDSYDPDGTIARYSWTQQSGPSTATIADADKANAQASKLVPGTYVFVLEVTDNDGLKGSATLTLEVSAAPVTPKAPQAKAGADQVITLPVNSVNLDGSASSDIDGSISRYQWSQLSGPAASVIGTASIAKTSVSNLVEGTFQFRLEVTDNSGMKAADTLMVTVKAQAVNQAPVAVVAQADIAIEMPADTVTLDGSASYDSDGTITTYQWKMLNGNGNPALSDPNKAVTRVSGLKQGVYVFLLTIKDDQGAFATKEVRVVVSNRNNGSGSSASLKTYPNPVNSNMTLRLDDEVTGKATVRIYTISGVVVFRDDIQKTSGTFIKTYNLSNLINGSYVLSVQYEDKPAVIRKFQKL